MTLCFLLGAFWGYRTLFYDVRLIVSPGDSSLRGDVALTLEIPGAPDTLAFHLTQNYTLDSLLCNGTSVSFLRDSDTVFVPGPLPAGTCTLRVFYGGKTLDRGLHFRDSTFFTFGQFYDSKAWLPCNDTPSAKAPARLVLTGPAGYFIASNGTLGSQGDSTFTWSEAHPVSPYLLVVAGGPYVRLDTSYGGIPIYYYVFPGDTAKARLSFQHIPDMMDLYTRLFGEYPFSDEKLAFVETEDPLGMETQTCIMVGSHTITGDLSGEGVFAHELAHQWWGDALTPESWREIWLNEGLAVWSDFSFTGHMYGVDSALSRWLWARGLYFKEDSSVRYPLRNPLYFTGATVYYKGAWVIRMLRWVLGDSLFFGGLRLYYASHRDGVVNTDDLQRAMEAYSPFGLGWFFREWCEDVGYPVVEYHWRQNGDTLLLFMDQVQDHGPWFRMPVEVVSVSGPDTARDMVWMQGPSDTFALEPGFAVSEVLLDPHYRVLMETRRVSDIPEEGPGPGLFMETVGRRGLLLENSWARAMEIRVYDPCGRRVMSRLVLPGKTFLRLPAPGLYVILWDGGTKRVILVQ